jgi:hypothetical protein
LEGKRDIRWFEEQTVVVEDCREIQGATITGAVNFEKCFPNLSLRAKVMMMFVQSPRNFGDEIP